MSKFIEIVPLQAFTTSASPSGSCRIYSTGEIIGEYSGIHISEQALVVKTDKGISVMSGCAHPGIIEILNVVKKKLNNDCFYCVLGGFHLMEEHAEIINHIVDEFKKLKVIKVGSTH